MEDKVNKLEFIAENHEERIDTLEEIQNKMYAEHVVNTETIKYIVMCFKYILGIFVVLFITSMCNKLGW